MKQHEGELFEKIYESKNSLVIDYEAFEEICKTNEIDFDKDGREITLSHHAFRYLETKSITVPSYVYSKGSDLYFNLLLPNDCSFLFASCTAEKIDLSNVKYTRNVVDVQSMFFDCANLKIVDLSNFDTDCVENMQYMFSNCSSLEELDLSSLLTSNVSNMCSMFANCSALNELNLANFDTYKTLNISKMFNGCRCLTNVNVNDGNIYEEYLRSQQFDNSYDDITRASQLYTE